jgi:hypothetical protein
MRVLAANAASMGTGIAAILETAQPVIAAIVSLSPTDACSIAAKLSLRYAVQCWEDPADGKAIFWKPSVALQGLYRVEFLAHDDGRDTREKRGLLRVTLVWDSQPLHVYCTQLSTAPHAADRQLVQVARELEGPRGATVLAADPGGARLPAWPRLPDALVTAQWRSIAYPQGADIGAVARGAFGVDPASEATAAEQAGTGSGVPRLFCSKEFSVHRVFHAASLGPRGASGAIFVDLAPAVNPGDGESEPIAMTTARSTEPADWTGTYSA